MGSTLHDVARVAGVSIKTVSNVINDYPHVRPLTRAKVQAAIVELDYRPNLSARGLAPAPSLYGLALVPFAVGLGLPWLLVSVLWRWRCRRKGWTPR